MTEINRELVNIFFKEVESKKYCNLPWEERLNALGKGHPKSNCQHGKNNFKHSRAVLKDLNLNSRQINAFLEVVKKHGASCDCELISKASARLFHYKRWDEIGE
jgi:hypothetical protein